MKKSKSMKWAAGIFVASVASLCLLTVTLAKYVTTGAVEETARVAKWGVTITAPANNIFSTSYAKDDQSCDLQTNTVISAADNTNLVAPGTTGKNDGFNISGQPEVAIRISNKPTVTLSNWNCPDPTNNSNELFYCPIKFTVEQPAEGDSTIIDGSTCVTTDDLITKLQNALTTSVDVEAGKDLSQTTKPTAEFTWEWPFNREENANQTDIKDTSLGNLQNAPTITIKNEISVTQID